MPMKAAPWAWAATSPRATEPDPSLLPCHTHGVTSRQTLLRLSAPAASKPFCGADSVLLSGSQRRRHGGEAQIRRCACGVHSWSHFGPGMTGPGTPRLG